MSDIVIKKDMEIIIKYSKIDDKAATWAIGLVVDGKDMLYEVDDYIRIVRSFLDRMETVRKQQAKNNNN